MDCPVLELYAQAVKNKINRIFLFDRAQWADINRLNPDHTYHLPLAANPGHKRNVIRKATSEQKKRYRADVCFVGSLYTEKSPYDRLEMKNMPDRVKGYIDGIMRAQEEVYGYYFIDELLGDDLVKEFTAHCGNFYPEYSTMGRETFLKDRDLLSLFYIGNKITANERMRYMTYLSGHTDVTIYTASDTSSISRLKNKGGNCMEIKYGALTQMPIAFHESKINLNMSSKAIRTGLPFRIFDVLSCGGFLLTNYQEELAENFEPGRELAVYGSREELLDLINYYIPREDERMKIAQAGMERLEAEHTFEKQQQL